MQLITCRLHCAGITSHHFDADCFTFNTQGRCIVRAHAGPAIAISFLNNGRNEMKQRHIVFLESNPTTGLRAIEESALKLGARITFITSDLEFYLKGKPLSDSQLRLAIRILQVANSGSFSELKSIVLDLNQRDPIDAFMSFSEYHMVPCAKLAEFLGLRHISSKAASIARNKFKTRRTLERARIPQPKFVMVRSVEKAIAQAERLGYPVVVKPIDGTASLNTRIVQNGFELTEQVTKIFSMTDYGRSTTPGRAALIEEFIDAPVVSVETLTVDGKHCVIGITDRTMIGEPYFVEGGYSFPVHPKNELDIINVALKALDAIGVQFGPTHTELFLTKKGPAIVEVNCRLAGGVIPQLIELATGRSILQDIVLLHAGEQPQQAITTSGVGTARFFFSKEKGVVTGIGESVRTSDPGVKDYVLNVSPGRSVNTVQSNFDRLGYVITHATSRKASESLCELILSETKVHVAEARA